MIHWKYIIPLLFLSSLFFYFPVSFLCFLFSFSFFSSLLFSCLLYFSHLFSSLFSSLLFLYMKKKVIYPPLTHIRTVCLLQLLLFLNLTRINLKWILLWLKITLGNNGNFLLCSKSIIFILNFVFFMSVSLHMKFILFVFE